MLERAWTALLGVTVGAALWSYFRWRSGGPRTRPVWKDVAFVTGVVLVAGSLVGPADRAADGSFFFHAIQHVVLGMVAPLLVVVADPLQLALQAAAPDTRARLRTVVRSRFVRRVGSGFVPLAFFAGGMWVVYLTPVYRLSVENDAVHALVHLHLLLAGMLLAWFLVGDRGGEGYRDHPIRMLTVVALVPVHAVIGVVLVSGDRILTAVPAPPFGWDALADQRAGATVLWVAGELVTVALAGVVLLRWKAAEDRIGRRHDRLLDRQAEDRTSGPPF